MKSIFFIILPLLIISGCSTTRNNSLQKSLVIKDVSVIDVVTGSVLSNQTLIIQDDRIAAMGVSSETIVPRNSKIVDGKGKFLIPGLWDAHVHLEIAGEESLPFFIGNIPSYFTQHVRELFTRKGWGVFYHYCPAYNDALFLEYLTLKEWIAD